MIVGSVYIEPKDILNKLSEKDKEQFNRCVFTDVAKDRDGSVTISYVVFNDNTSVQPRCRIRL